MNLTSSFPSESSLPALIYCWTLFPSRSKMLRFISSRRSDWRHEKRLLDHPGWAKSCPHWCLGGSQQTARWQQGALCGWDSGSHQSSPQIHAVCNSESSWSLWWEKGILLEPESLSVVKQINRPASVYTPVITHAYRAETLPQRQH